jgi:hypothetical protein
MGCIQTKLIENDLGHIIVPWRRLTGVLIKVMKNRFPCDAQEAPQMQAENCWIPASNRGACFRRANSERVGF